MRTVYRPEQTKHWTGADLAALVGRYVVVEVPASEGFRRHVPDADFEGASGLCEQAAIGRFDQAFVEFDDGTGWDWNRYDGAWVSVCDEHGDHQSADGALCAGTLGAPR